MLDTINDAISANFDDIQTDHRDYLLSTIAKPSLDTQALGCLYQIVLSICPKNILEIGLATGSSASCHALAAGSNLVRMDIIDPFQKSGFRNVGLDNVGNALGDGKTKLSFFEIPSHMAMSHLISAKIQYDYIFIDGDHRFDATMVDVFFADKLLKVGGYLVIDDRPWPMVGAVVEFMCANYRHYEVDLRHPRLTIFRKISEDGREWFDFWKFEVPDNPVMQKKIDGFQAARDEVSK